MSDYIDHSLLPHQRWNTPQWRDSKSYEFINFLSPSLRRWEFLRRQRGYRSAWQSLGAAHSAFGLLRLLDPRLTATDYEKDIVFLDWSLAGGPTGLMFEESPAVAQIAKQRLSEDEVLDELARHYGRQYMAIREAGYILFAVDLGLGAQPQLDKISDQIKKWQKEDREKARDEEETYSHQLSNFQKKKLAGELPKNLKFEETSFPRSRVNSKPFGNLMALLRILDACDQERIGTDGATVSKVETVNALFPDQQIDSKSKYFDSIYSQAVEQSRPPFPIERKKLLPK